jgi:hypothetical protein
MFEGYFPQMRIGPLWRVGNKLLQFFYVPVRRLQIRTYEIFALRSLFDGLPGMWLAQ